MEIAHFTIDNNNSIDELNKKASRYANRDTDIISSETATRKLMQFMMMNVQNVGKRIFFIYPPNQINNNEMILELIKSGYEIYNVNDHNSILKVLKQYNSSVIFVNIDKKMDEYYWEKYIRNIQEDPETKEVRIGIISNTDNKAVKTKYLMELNVQCGFIKLTENLEENLNLLNTIFRANEIKGRRKYIRAPMEKDDNCGFEIQADNTLYTGDILDISIAGMRCVFTNNERFVINRRFDTINIDLSGTIINIGGEITMHHEGTNSYVIMFENIQDSENYDDLIFYIYTILQNKLEKLMTH